MVTVKTVHACSPTSNSVLKFEGLGVSFPKSWERELKTQNGNSEVFEED